MKKEWINVRCEYLRARMSPCVLCPRACGTLRIDDNSGFCGLDDKLKIFCTNLHFGEEPPISGTRGSGAVFFSGCNLKCVFCQNFAFSQRGSGENMTPEMLAERMLELEKRGAHNINWVTPTPQLAQAVEALRIARAAGLSVPLVYNCGGYESVEILKYLAGIVDIYLPDAKYSDSEIAEKYSSAQNYWEMNKRALKEMYRQVGGLALDASGIAKKGLIVRHLVLPNGLSGTREVLRFVAEELSNKVTISLMSQYFPTNLAVDDEKIGRKISEEEYSEAIGWLEELGFENAYVQE